MAGSIFRKPGLVNEILSQYVPDTRAMVLKSFVKDLPLSVDMAYLDGVWAWFGQRSVHLERRTEDESNMPDSILYVDRPPTEPG